MINKDFHDIVKHMHFAKMQRVNQNIVVLWTKNISEVTFIIFFLIHDIFYLDARAVQQIKMCVAIFILAALRPFSACTPIVFGIFVILQYDYQRTFKKYVSYCIKQYTVFYKMSRAICKFLGLR